MTETWRLGRSWRLAAFALWMGIPACGAGASGAQGHPASAITPAAPSMSADPAERALDDVARIHGEAGPWAVAGYRMGQFALAKLELPRGSFDLEVTHHTPHAVKFSCIADGAAASTGASAGKLNLTLVDADERAVETVYRRKSTGKTVILRPTASFAARFADFPRSEARARGREVLSMPESEVFEEVRDSR